MAATTTVVDFEIPSTSVIYTGASKLNAISIQGDGDFNFQFFKTDGTTALTGLVHLGAYEVYNIAVVSGGDGVILSSSGIKLVLSGNASGKVRGYISGAN